MKILDATAGFRGIWYIKNHPFVTFLDKRTGYTKNTNGTKIKNRRHFKLDPDIIADWTKTIPFDDEYFDMVIFDPPHFIIDNDKSDSCLTLRYGRIDKSNYKQYLGAGFKELFRVLKKEGVFILKWCENTHKVDDIIKLSPYPALFGSKTGQNHKNYWILFIKYRLEKTLEVL